ncbi:MAG: hypothetical protein LRZ84_07620 [Desertifilum sp.]|nr:hypothetical protein [Desertifilum sp.]
MSDKGEQGKDKKYRISIHLAGLGDRLKQFSADERISVSAAVRRITAIFLELVEALEEANIPLPREGKVREWLQQNLTSRSLEQSVNDTHRTIASYIRERNLVELSDETGISIKRLNDLAQGVKPLVPELSLLELGLNITIEELTELYKREFNGQKEKINGF